MKRIIIELDNTETIQTILKNIVDQHYSVMTLAIKNMLQFLWMFKVTRTFVEGNKIADGLALMAFSRPK
ncbi:hypothetical protein J1N35_016891 [Gossypium stocksii]|uniref:RNase H type-1 domain-containing protein n=1 Tax=Gossypium stocksii TaxID=47602 RepID=A0A9D4A4L9_9ROSI|nr:hypothetical protein J1N35_016891 [Gossypium stocksii]